MIEVLVVEDDVHKYNDILGFLNHLGLNGPAIFWADNVASAMNYLREKKFNIIILDLNIPLRNKSLPVENGGRKILYALTSTSYMTPDYVIGLTQYEEYQKSYTSDFNQFDFNIYNYHDDSWKVILEKKIEWIKRSTSGIMSRTTNKKIIVCTHGIMTMGTWPLQIESLFPPPDYKVVTYRYPHYSALKIILPWFRRGILDHYSQFIRNILDSHPNCDMNFISHSFGTYLLMRTLQRVNISYRPNITNIILCGSVIKSDFNLDDIISKFEPRKIINDCAFNDNALLICNILCAGLGNAGRIGFNGYNDRVINRYLCGGHSVFFENGKVERNWKSVIMDDNYIEIDERKFSTTRENIESLINVFSPLLLPLVIIIFLLFVF